MECKRGLAMRILSVCLSVKRVICDKTAERPVESSISCERSFSLVFWDELLVEGDTFYLKFLGQTDRVGAKSPIFDLFSLVAPQP